MILPNIFIASASGKGRGVFAAVDIDRGTVIETSPVIVMSAQERVFLDQTLLHDYIFEWGREPKRCCMALGYVPLYNHSYSSNCEYEMDYEQEQISVKAIRFIRAGEELFLNYNGNWNDETPLWFEAE